MERFIDDQRVLVKTTYDGISINAVGTVTRVCTDGSAWIVLDRPNRQHGARVRARSEDCDLATTNARERRVASRTKEPAITIEVFGRDHWSTLLYIETRIVDHRGELDRRHMRCDRKRHPYFAHLSPAMDTKEYPTRLRDGALLHNHDDWDCADDLESVGLIENIGTGAQRVYRLTEEGRRIVSLLRQHKAHGLRVALFTLPPGNSRSDRPGQSATTPASCPPATR